MDNRIVIAGVVENDPETRFSPAGVPIVRFILRHSSVQMEAGSERRADCTLPILACGEPLANEAKALGLGTQVRVSGFLTRANNRQGEFRLVLHAQTIERSDSETGR